MADFGKRLKELREDRGLSQGALAEKAGMNLFGIAKLEQGKRDPAWKTVQKLAEALGVSCEAFQDGAGDAVPAPKRKPKPKQ